MKNPNDKRALSKTLYVGNNSDGRVFVTVKFNDGKLSLTGVIGPTTNGNARGSCGQIIDSIGEITNYHKGFNDNNLRELITLWNRWHLNDMRAGLPIQEEFIRNLEKDGWKYTSYDATCAKLKENNLYEVNGYKYGHKWNFEEVPDEVLQFFDQFEDCINMLPEVWRK